MSISSCQRTLYYDMLKELEKLKARRKAIHWSGTAADKKLLDSRIRSLEKKIERKKK